MPLLTAQDEVDLAKSIEAGLFAEEKLQAADRAADAAALVLAELASSPPTGCGPSSG